MLRGSDGRAAPMWKLIGCASAVLLTIYMAVVAEKLLTIIIGLIGMVVLVLLFIAVCINAVNRSGSDTDFPGGDGGGG